MVLQQLVVLIPEFVSFVLVALALNRKCFTVDGTRDNLIDESGI